MGTTPPPSGPNRVNQEGTSYLNKGQRNTDEDDMVLCHMAIIPFPVLCQHRNVLRRVKTTKPKFKDD